MRSAPSASGLPPARTCWSSSFRSSAAEPRTIAARQRATTSVVASPRRNATSAAAMPLLEAASATTWSRSFWESRMEPRARRPDDVVEARALEAEDLGARQDRRRHLVELGRREDEADEGRRLLEGLQE